MYRYLSKQYIHVYVYIYRHVCMYVYIYILIHIYIYIQESYLPGTKLGLEIQLQLPKKPEVPFFCDPWDTPQKRTGLE